MKRILNLITTVFVLGLLFTMLSGCSSSKPADILTRFEKANNDRDIKALLDCYDPDATAFFKAIGEGLSGGLFGSSVDTDSVLPFFSKAFQAYVTENDVYAKIKLTEISTTMINDEKAKIKYTETVVFPDGRTEDSEQAITAVKKDGKWYIAFF